MWSARARTTAQPGTAGCCGNDRFAVTSPVNDLIIRNRFLPRCPVIRRLPDTLAGTASRLCQCPRSSLQAPRAVGEPRPCHASGPAARSRERGGLLPALREDVTRSNRTGGHASDQWAYAYVETNTLITSLNVHLTGLLRAHGLNAAGIPPTHNFDQERLMSHWSHRHVAWIAGLGTFRVNRMLITQKDAAGGWGAW